MVRYVIVGKRIGSDWDKGGMPACHYITANGCITSNGDKASVCKGESEAVKELEYWQAVMRSKEVDLHDTFLCGVSEADRS